MNGSIELQVISRILTSDSESEIDELCKFDETYYSILRDHIHFILEHRSKYNAVPDVFTFQAKFPNVELLRVSESLEYLQDEMRDNKKRILLVETFNKLKDLSSGDVSDAWKYISLQYEKVEKLSTLKPMDIVKDAAIRSQQIVDFNRQARIPTGFAEIDKLMYGGLSTVEELLLIIARTNTGKSWVCTKMMESAQRNGFPVAYYSPEMQASFLGTRFDTWRSHFSNSELYRGKYSEEYKAYITRLSNEDTSAFVIEDKDMADGVVNVSGLRAFVKEHNIKLLIIDGLSYMEDDRRSDTDYVKYKNICADLFKLSKQFNCAVVVAMQANRDTQNTKDDKGDVFPSLYNCEGSDHPGRIATQAFALRQIFDKHVLDIRLEKSRIANNQKPILSYAWDVSTGNMQYLPGGPDDATLPPSPTVTPKVAVSSVIASSPRGDDIQLDDDDTDDVEF